MTASAWKAVLRSLRTLLGSERLDELPPPARRGRRSFPAWLVEAETLQPGASAQIGAGERAVAIEHRKHVFRVFILLGAVVASALVVRILLVPETFGRYGHYRAADLAGQAAREVRHGGNDACAPCHAPIKARHDAGAHLPVPCEDCHDALAAHVREGRKIADMPRVRSVTRLCGRCHRDLTARRADFPRVNVEQHVKDQGAEPSDQVCFDCHNPHNPAP